MAVILPRANVSSEGIRKLSFGFEGSCKRPHVVIKDDPAYAPSCGRKDHVSHTRICFLI